MQTNEMCRKSCPILQMRKGTIRDFSMESSVCAEYNSAGFKNTQVMTSFMHSG